MNKNFNLAAAVEKAEAGDHALWEDIARHLLAKQPKPKKPKNAGGQTWAHVILADGREFLTSAYTKMDMASTMKAHQAAAQFRGRMEDSGDRGQVEWGGRGVFLNPKVKPVAVKLASLLNTPEEIDQIRMRCFNQRAKRQGWNAKAA